MLINYSYQDPHEFRCLSFISATWWLKVGYVLCRQTEKILMELCQIGNSCIKFTVLRLAQEFFTYIWRSHHYRWRAAKFRRMLGASATSAAKLGLGFSSLIRRTAPNSIASYDTQGDVESLFRGGWGVSIHTFGYKRTAEIFKTPPFIYSIFLKTILIHIFPLKTLTQSYISFQNSCCLCK
jgi:hypothetical protein